MDVAVSDICVEETVEIAVLPVPELLTEGADDVELDVCAEEVDGITEILGLELTVEDVKDVGLDVNEEFCKELAIVELDI